MNPLLNSAINTVVIVGGCLALSMCTNPAYASPVQPHVGLALTGYNLQGTQSAPNAVFLCVPFAYARSMAWLEGDAFARAGNLVDQSVNPFQLCHPHLTVNGRASFLQGVTP